MESIGVICACGHLEEGHEKSGLWDTFCAEFNELSCACIRYIPGKDFKCVCGHATANHHLQDAGVAYCDVFVLKACGCNEMRPIELRKGRVMLARSEDTISDPRLAELKKPKRAKLFSMAILLLGVSIAATSFSAVNVYTSPSAPAGLQADLLAALTTQYNATVTTSTFAGTYTVTLFSKKTVPPPAPPPATDPKLITLDSITNKLVANSTYTLVAGYAMGMMYERMQDAGYLGSLLGSCDSPSTFGAPCIDSYTCNMVLGFADNYLVMKTSGIAVVPDPIP